MRPSVPTPLPHRQSETEHRVKQGSNDLTAAACPNARYGWLRPAPSGSALLGVSDGLPLTNHAVDRHQQTG